MTIGKKRLCSPGTEVGGMMTTVRRLAIRNRLLVILGLILLVSFAAISYLNYTISRASVHAEILRNDLPLTMDNIYSELTFELTRPLLVSSSMATDTFVHDWAQQGEQEVDKIIRYLEQIRSRYGFFTSFFVSASTDTYYRYNGVHKTISRDDTHDVWFFDFVASGEEYDFDVDTDEGADNVLTIFINYRVEDRDGRLLGVTGVGLRLGAVAERVGEYRKRYGRDVYLADTRGILQVHPDTSLIEQVSIAEMEGLTQYATEILAEKEQIQNYGFDRGGEKILLTVRHMEPLGWYLFVEQNETKALATARNNLITTLVIGLFSSLLIIGLALFTINRYQDRIEAFAVRDELTGIANRRALEPEFKRMAYNFRRADQSFSVLLLDLDGFKLVNDQLGHMAGDAFLKETVERISTVVRGSDIFARWGGDEFVVLTENDREGSLKVAKRICQVIEDRSLQHRAEQPQDPRNNVTVSCGIAIYRQGEDFDSVLRRADKAMYRCKEQGGNMVEFEV
jgi:diguanylate cyclase (GGDEF)-like protein